MRKNCWSGPDENVGPVINAALRKRLGEPWLIATVPGVGYRVDITCP